VKSPGFSRITVFRVWFSHYTLGYKTV